MEPTLKVGSIHIGVKYDQEPQIGDIYCYRYKPASIKDNFASSILLSSSEFLILHRLVNVDSSDCNNYFYYFKGDNNLKMDEPVSEFDILYKIY